MRHHRSASQPSPLYLLLLAAACGATLSGCASLAERVATHLVEKDLDSLDQEFGVFEADLGLFRQCLKRRGGTCQGSDLTALPHTSQDAPGQAVAPVSTGPSQTLTDSVGQLAAGNPAKSALAVLGHPVVRQAAALHDHLRGHETAGVAGFSVTGGQASDGVPESTATVSLGIGQVGHFHKGLLNSLGTGGWKSLHRHCTALLAAPENAPERTKLEADCRRVAFVRTYLEAYTRKGEFLEVDVELAGAIQAVNEGAAKIESDIDALLAELQGIEADVAQDEADVLAKIGVDAGRVGAEVTALIANVEGDLTKRFGTAAATVFADLTSLAGEISGQSEALAQAADKALTSEVEALVSDLDRLLGELKTRLDELETQVGAADQTVVRDLNEELGKADAALSNVFRVSNVGFVSRDDTFQARLPTFEVTVDPTVKDLVKVTDVDTGQILTGNAAFGSLGVASDTSGVGTGSAVGAEVVRVFLEAIFDAHEGLPAVAPANLPNVKPTGLALGAYSLPLFTSPMGNVDSGDLSHMTHINDQVAARTRALVSRIIAGIGPFSLNNEPLEAFIVEIITTTVRQATSKASWCWYACDLNVDLEALEADAKNVATDAAKEVAEQAEAAGGRVEEKAKQAAERVKLRLKLSQ